MPNEFERAAARAETPGPGTEEWGGPARGVKLPDSEAPAPVWLGVGICGTRGVPTGLCEGTGEANRAVEAALGIGLPDNRPLNEPGVNEPGEDDIGTGRGLADELPSFEDDMATVVFVICDFAVVGQRMGALSHLRKRKGTAVPDRQPQCSRPREPRMHTEVGEHKL